MTSQSNISSWQRAIVDERGRLLDHLLSDLKRRRVRFLHISDLASHLAEMIASHELAAWEDANSNKTDNSHGRPYIRKPRGCAQSTLLRNNDYRTKLDAWWSLHCHSHSRDDTVTHNMTNIFHKLEIGNLNKTLSIYRNRIERLENELEQYRAKSPIPNARMTSHTETGLSNETAAICKALHLLITEFSQQVILHENQLVTNSFAKRVVVQRDLLTTYLEWLKLNARVGDKG